MKKAFYGVALLSSMILTACTDGPEEPKIPGIGDGSTKLVAPVFAPGNGELPVPNDVLFSDTADLTLNIPTADPTDMSDPQNALNALDGWSTHAPFSIEFRGDIDGSTVTPGQTVRLFKVSVDRPEAIPGTGIPAPTGPVTGVEAELVAGVDFVAVPASSSSVGVVPLRPFEAQSSYMVVVTNGILDTNGNPVISDAQFSVVKSTDPIDPGSATAGLEPLRQLTQLMLAASESQGINRDDVVLTYQFTVQSIADATIAAKQFYIDYPLSLNAPPATSFEDLNTSTAPFTGIGAANLYKGQVTLPYLLTAPTVDNPTAVLDNYWVGADMVPGAEGGMVPNPLAGGFITYANKLPQKTGDEVVPLLVSIPQNVNCPKPYPVLIFQHGITSNRTSMLGIADTMAGTCTAVVAMDLPLHGIVSSDQVHLGVQALNGGIGIFEGYAAGGVRERTFGVDYIDNNTSAPGPDGIVDPSGAHTINLSNLLVSRDNLRQATLDLLALEKAIPFMDVDGDLQPDFDATKISFMGHSLGGITGSPFAALTDLSSVNILATTSGSAVQLLNGSPTFGPIIRAGLAAASGVPTDHPAFESEVLNPFLFAAQTAIDAGDPVNYAVLARAENVPTLALQVKDDQVVPNTVTGAPLAGSTPHAALYALATVTESTATDRAFLKYVSGDHASPLSPAADMAVTVSMQTAIASFIASGGTQVVVSDPNLVEP